MVNDWLDEFFLGGADEPMNSQVCSHCGKTLYLDQPLEWIDRAQKICKCPSCGKEVKISG